MNPCFLTSFFRARTFRAPVGRRAICISNERGDSDRITAEITERLEATGSVNLNDMASHFKLAFEVLEENVKELLPTLNASYHNPILYTESHLDRYASQIRGTLRAATRPISLKPVFKEFPFAPSLFNCTLVAKFKVFHAIYGPRLPLEGWFLLVYVCALRQQ